jgi:Conserved phage C-terminus (Phg_2220_C)
MARLARQREMRQYFNPETLFRESKFDKYLNAARMGNNGKQHNGGFVA